MDTHKGEQHLPSFRAINPNGKTPALEDGAAGSPEERRSHGCRIKSGMTAFG